MGGRHSLSLTNGRVVNLIALIFRPMRLFLPTEKVRPLKILMLKTLHFPFVVLIWGYEQSCQQLRGSRGQSNPPAGAHRAGGAKDLGVFDGGKGALLSMHPDRRGARGAATGRLSLAASNPSATSTPQLPDPPPSGSLSTADTLAELMALVNTLNAKVDDLSSRVDHRRRD